MNRSHLALLLALMLVPAAAAAPQNAPRSGALPAVSAGPLDAASSSVSTLLVVSGGSTVVQTDFPITRIAVNNPDIANATVVDPRELLIDGKTPGTVSIIVWGPESQMLQFAVIVFPPTPSLQRQLKLIFPDEEIQVSSADEAIVLSGHVKSGAVARQAVEIAEKSSAKSSVINLLQVGIGEQSQQVMLQVQVAEVSQRALLEVGSTFFTGEKGYHHWVGRVTTQQFAAPNFEGEFGGRSAPNSLNEANLSFGNFLNLFLLNTRYNVGTVISALRARGYFQSLAEPTLIAYNGQEASFLAGGEVPVPVVQGTTGAVSVTYKEFGVRLNFRPTISGSVIRLQVRPEVSSLDFANGVTMEGFRIPALITRRAETDVELRDGQSFAIGGLLNNLSQTDRASIPVLGDLPIIGYFFKSKAERKERTELVVIITPRLVQPLTAAPPLPVDPDEFLPAPSPGTR